MNFFELTPEEKKILAEVAQKLEPQLDEILAEWTRTLDHVGFFDHTPMPREVALRMGEEAIRGHITSMKSGLLEDHAARMRESEVRVQSAPEMDYRDIAVPEMIFHSLCYPRISVLYEDPSRRQEAISILSKA
ncbi:MAG: hypothetical protein SVX38_16985, partial [Chloroflexota bacterium]|nr:hypothetical protein [Chloroflexota bacterium]